MEAGSRKQYGNAVAVLHLLGALVLYMLFVAQENLGDLNLSTHTLHHAQTFSLVFWMNTAYSKYFSELNRMV